MSSVGLSGLSNISNDTLQGRYEKALKQINKLIEINRELKERVGEYQGEIGVLTGQIQNIKQKNRQLDEESNILDANYMELKSHYEQLEEYCKTLEEKLDVSRLSSQEIDLRLQQAERKYEQDLREEAERYELLARESDLLQQGYQEGLQRIQRHEEEQRALMTEREALRQENAELKACNARLGQIVTEKHICQLQGQLQQANRGVQRLMKECNELRGRQIDFQVLEQKQKVERYIGLSTSINDHQGDAVKELIQQYKRKITALQSQKKEIQSKCKTLKSKLKNTDNYQKKIESLQRLTEKQQREIARIIETYDRELNTLHRENVKTREAYISVSQSLSRKGHEVNQRQKAISELKMTTDRMGFENESLRKVNYTLIEEKENKLRELSVLKDKIQHTESFTLGHVRSQGGQDEGEKVKLKISQVQKGIYSVPSTRLDDPFLTSTFKNDDVGRIPITVSYSSSPANNEKGDFKFIQSVNIINGYNVSLGENSGSSRHNQ